MRVKKKKNENSIPTKAFHACACFDDVVVAKFYLK